MEEGIKALVIGLVQGLTEFLPISSSGHIELSKAILNFNIEEEQSLLFVLVLHTATALSTLFVFRKKIIDTIKGILLRERTYVYFALKITISMIPAGIVGYFMKDTIEQLFSGNVLFVGCMLLITAFILSLADRAKSTRRDVSLADSLIIGLAQAIAILPGISRSGSTIATFVILGNNRAKAAEFSFLMVIPLIFGAMIKGILDSEIIVYSNEMLSSLSIGFFSAFFAGIFACKWMIRLVKNTRLWYFSIYCAIVGFLSVLYAIFFN